MTDQTDDATEWPSFREELGRKGLQALDKYATLHLQGKISARELYIVADVLFDAMSGLADWSATDLVAKVHEDIRQNAKRAAEQKQTSKS